MYQEIFEHLNSDRHGWVNETEVRHGWLRRLENGLGLTIHAERGRNDARYNQIIIEFKTKGGFYGSASSYLFRQAIFERLAIYIPQRAAEEGIPLSEYVGIATDGDHIAFARMTEAGITYGDLMPLCIQSVDMVCMALINSRWRALTSENLIEDFGHNSVVGIGLMQALANAVSLYVRSPYNNKIKMMFEEWKTFLGQVADLSRNQRVDFFRFNASVSEDLDLPVKLFVIHTYNSLLIKLLAAEILSRYGLASWDSFAEYAACQPIESLKQVLQCDIENGQLFERASIRGFVEEAIFSWYLEILDEPAAGMVHERIRDVLTKIAVFRMDSLGFLGPQDLLRNFYQDLVPDVLRKNMGEFYTPDWLIELTIERANIGDVLNLRVLDPTCGSGAFLVHIIQKKWEAGRNAGWDSYQLLDNFTQSVWGFDLNPLAVQTSRVNFLFAIVRLLRECPGYDIEIPVMLADAVYSPATNRLGNDDVTEYRLGSEHANLNITMPTELVSSRIRLNSVFSVMMEFVEREASYDQVEPHLVNRRVLSLDEIEAWREYLRGTYDQVLSLHRQNWNGIWFRIARNFFWSAVAGQFDLIIGNPPWVRWSNLPRSYRARINETCRSYDIFAATSYHGGNELDISAMIVYTTADKWLRENGTLAFVITQSHFQAPSSAGFRSFSLGNYVLEPISVDDLRHLKPFPGVMNKTAVLVLRKTQNGTIRYPIPYREWNKANGYSNSIDPSLDLSDVYTRIIISDMEATPARGDNSPWCILPPGEFELMQRILGKCATYQGRKGITTDLNGIFMVEILDINDRLGKVQITTRPEAGRIDIGRRQTFWIEPDMMYPLIKGASDFTECYISPSSHLYVIVPNRSITNAAYGQAQQEVDVLPLIRRYFQTYERQLQRRSTYQTRMPNAPYYCIYNVGEYTFAPYKVIWPEVSYFRAAVVETGNVPLIGDRPYVPDHKIFFVDFTDKSSAYFLCGLLTSELVKRVVEGSMIPVQRGDIFKLLDLPEFNPDNRLHCQLAADTIAAHQEDDTEARKRKINQCRLLATQILFDR